MKDILLRVRLDPVELARLRFVAQHIGVTMSDVVRILVKERADALGWKPGAGPRSTHE